uniref:CCDC66 domain-containing protein n=1 Tax=Heterorhabditis bacteriophora TaxID=37862 RepID=A0A1I7XPY3_HETBA
MATALQQLGTMRSADPQQLLALQGMLMQVVTQSQVKAVESQRRNEEKKKEEERHKLEAQQANLKTIEALRKKVEDEREAKKKAREEEKHRIIAQKKAEAAAAKEKALEEKRLKQEEEKKQKLAEKARKAEEERQRRIQEQAEKERKMLEERERIAKEEAERVKLEEEEKRRIEMVRVKMSGESVAWLQEQDKARELEEQRLAKMREEEEKAVQLIEEEIRWDSNDPEDISAEERTALEVIPKEGNLAGPTCGFSSPSAHHGMMRSPHQPISASPQYQGNFGYPNSHGSNSIAQSPQAMTPPSSGYTTAHRSPALQSIQQHNSSPYQQQPVQSPMNSSINQQTHIGLQQHNQMFIFI